MQFHQRAFVRLITVILACLCAPAAFAYLDLHAASIERLDNGLTLIVLEDHTFPVVSLQILYRVGARNEPAGATGLAHFLEHMAFRSSQNFPDTQLVSSIYAAGGEWHGYTWLDQTTYFATVPSPQLDLLLRIESDRMARLDLSEADLPAERGAILAEMHGYENDPLSVLHDNVMYLVFLAHPYRNNTIGWESDVVNTTHADLVDFYRQHYQPGNAVLAVVGDVRADQVRRQVQQYFGEIAGRAATPAPHTIEPGQQGERRIYLRGELERKYFKIAYRAPAASHPDYAAFLLMQDLLAGGSGVSFLQNDWGTRARTGSPLDGIADDLTTWFPPLAQDYVFTIGGYVSAGASEEGVENAIENAIGELRGTLAAGDSPAASALEQSKKRVREALVFDVQTTEDAAHQLAFFTGLDALEALTGLPPAVDRVNVADIGRVMDHYLRKTQRTIGWYVPGDTTAGPAIDPSPSKTGLVDEQQDSTAASTAPKRSRNRQPETTAEPSQAKTQVASPPRATHLSNGIPVIFQRSGLSATVSLKLVTIAAAFPPEAPNTPNHPLWGLTSLDFDMLPEALPAAIDQAGSTLKSAEPMRAPTEPDAGDPAALQARYFEDILGLKTPAAEMPLAPLLLVISGDIDPSLALPMLEKAFGSLSPVNRVVPAVLGAQQKMDIEVRLKRAVAQEQLAWLVRAPGPGEADALAWQMALYVLSHGYEGRLGKEAISRRGLIYYIDSAYHSDGRNGWITLSMGVDPDKLPEMKALLQEELLRLVQEPPSQQEIDEARQHLLGRYLSAAQSNPELTDALALQWLWYGRLIGYEDLQRRLSVIRREDIIRLLPAFVAGTTISIRNPRPQQAPAVQ